ncbi:MAG: NAD-dependent protein deacylase [Clostridia bacterium]|nr:NAD-dependent protein deacylase [Clostridia bacterium]
MDEGILRLGEMIEKAQRIVFFGGAGVSTESGIPDFRSAHGIYAGAQGKSYEEMLSHGYFVHHTESFWRFYKNVMLYPDALPNDAHRVLAMLEHEGKLKAVLTQNIDGLHQLAGSKNVLELHGTVHRNFCMRCGHQYDLSDILSQEDVPRCMHCGGLLKPDVVLYGEQLDSDVLEESIRQIEMCDLLIVGGTSLMVHPAAGLISYRRRGVPLVLINRDETPYDGMANLILRGNIAQVLKAAVE